MAAVSLIDVMCALGIAATVSSIGVADVRNAVDDARASGAARYLAARLQQARMEAVASNRATALRWSGADAAYCWLTYEDGNANGVLSADIQAGIDRPVGVDERLSERFPGVDFGALPGLPAVEPGGVAPGADPIRLGAGNMATFTPLGTATSGTLYLRGRGTRQYAVRILGETGRVRVLKFHPSTRVWMPVAGS